MKNKKKLITIVTAVLSVAALAVGSLALFTDRFQSEVELTAGSLELVLEQDWVGENSAVAQSFKPGYALKMDYDLSLGGNMAGLVKEKLVISTDKALTQGTPEFALYAASDVDVSNEGIATIHVGAAPIVASTGTYTEDAVTWHKLSYEFDSLVLNGSIEKPTGGVDKKEGAYVLVFSENASNDFQGVKIKVEYLAQALQYGNTGEDTWSDANVVTESVTIGGVTESVVPKMIVPGA